MAVGVGVPDRRGPAGDQGGFLPTSAGGRPSDGFQPGARGAQALLTVGDHLELVTRLVKASAQGAGDGGDLEEFLAALRRSSAALGEWRPRALGRALSEATEQPGSALGDPAPAGPHLLPSPVPLPVGAYGEEEEVVWQSLTAGPSVPLRAARPGGEVEGTAGVCGVPSQTDHEPPPQLAEGDDLMPPKDEEPKRNMMMAGSGKLAARFGDAVSGSHFDGAQKMSYSRHPALRAMERAMNSNWMECVSALLIAINTMFMILEVQYVGAKIGHEIGIYPYYGSDRFFEDSGALAPDVFAVIDVVFCVLYTIELLLRLSFQRLSFLCDPWGWLDIAIVLTTDITTFLFQGGEAMPVTSIRVLRLARLLRIMKLARSITFCDSLYLMTTALRGSMSALTWVIIFLLLTQTLFALLLTNIVQDFYLTSSGDGDEFFQTSFEKEEAYKYFGTYWRSMVSLFELMLANWPPICRMMMETMHEFWSVFALGYKLFMGFAVIGVIMGVFTQETFRAADSDDHLMIKRKASQAKTHSLKMKALFEKMANDNFNGEDNNVDLSLFEEVLQSPVMRLWLKAMDYDVCDASLLFYLIDKDGDGVLTVDELIEGMASLKGGARNIDVKLLMRQSPAGLLQRRSSLHDLNRMTAANSLRLVEATRLSENDTAANI